MRTSLFTATLLCLVTPAIAGKNPPDPPAATWNNPPPEGVEKLKPSAPTWCAGHKPRPWFSGNLLYEDVKRGYTETLLTEIAQLACDRPDDPGRQAWIAFYRQGWLNIVGTTDAEDRVAMAARLHNKEEYAKLQKFCKQFRHKRDDDITPADRVFDELRGQALGCDGVATEIKWEDLANASYWIDRAPEPPDELVRLAFVLRCFNTGDSSVDPKSAVNTIGNHAFCGHDARALDRKTFERDLAKYEVPAFGLARARENFAYTKKLLASHLSAYDALVKKDKDYAPLLVDGPEAGFAAWIKTRADNKAALDEALAMEDKFRDEDKKAVAGCSESLRKQLTAHVRAQKPKTKDDIKQAVNDEVGQPILKALIACDSLQGRHGLVDFERNLLSYGRERRGPRTAAFWHTLDMLAEAGKDKSPKKFLQPNAFGAPRPTENTLSSWMRVAWEATFNQTSFERDQKGQIAGMKAQGDGFFVTFKQQSWQEPIWECHDTNKIDRITADGKVEYRQSCVSKGMQTVKSTPRPGWVRKDLAAGMKPGMFLVMAVDLKPDPDQGFPLEVYADAAQKKLVQYLGFTLGN